METSESRVKVNTAFRLPKRINTHLKYVHRGDQEEPLKEVEEYDNDSGDDYELFETPQNTVFDNINSQSKCEEGLPFKSLISEQ